ncbi:MAG TPA: hypothetical protein VLB44_23345, partial [Kofleriaceae bacterium]|nr:hypothetical protein [Kofleriaceae bacterium]
MRRLLLLVAVLGCRGQEAKPHAGSAGSAAVGSAAGSAGSAAAGSAAAGSAAGSDVESFGPAIPEVKLDKPGSEPRHVIAYVPHAAERSAKLSLEIGMEDAPPGTGTGWTLVVSWRSPADVAHPYELTVKES